ncbi:MAG: hypothetical protein WD852_05710 [Methyloceanibacter sp.]
MSDWTLVVKEADWASELEPYTKRIRALGESFVDMTAQMQKFPGLLDFAPTAAGSVRHRALIKTNETVASAQELWSSILLLWSQGHLLAATHCVRLMLELWALLLFLQSEIIEKLTDGSDAGPLDELLQRLMLGTNSNPLLPAGLQGPFDLVRITKLNKIAKEKIITYQEDYAFLCDVSHPTFIHFYFQFVRLKPLWSNPYAVKERHRILEHVTSALERAMSGVRDVTIKIYEECIPPLASEIESAAQVVENS